MRLLVTGGAGYIGSVVTAQLLDAGHAVTVLDDLSTGHADAIPDGATFIQGSLLDPAGLGALPGRGFDGILHFAAKSLVGESMQHPGRYWRNNVGGTLELLDAMTAAGVPRLVFSSTAAVYGEPGTVPIPESAPTRPGSAYGGSKLAVDTMIGTYIHAHGLAATSLRYFNVAGASGRFGERHTTETHLIPIVLDVAAGRREQVQVYGTDYPTPTAQPFATTSMSRTSPGPTCWRSTRPRSVGRPSTTWATARATQSTRSSRPPVASRSGPSMQSTPLVALATQPSWSPPAPWPPPNSAGPPRSPPWTTWSTMPGHGC